MPAPEVLALILALALGLAFVLLFLPRLIWHLMKKPLNARVAASYQPEEVQLLDLRANYFGAESAGAFQVRGNGALVLTNRELHFFQFWPKRELRVPLKDIVEVSLGKAHLGKVTPFDLLKVRFSTDEKPDLAAWYVKEPLKWRQGIESRIPARVNAPAIG